MYLDQVRRIGLQPRTIEFSSIGVELGKDIVNGVLADGYAVRKS
jgi:hypothetical protein